MNITFIPIVSSFFSVYSIYGSADTKTEKLRSNELSQVEATCRQLEREIHARLDDRSYS